MVGKNSPQGPATGETEQMGMGHPAALAVPMILNSRCSFDDKIVDTTQRDRPQEKDSLKGGASLSRTFAGSSGKPGFS
jgi:hypothetical protein